MVFVSPPELWSDGEGAPLWGKDRKEKNDGKQKDKEKKEDKKIPRKWIGKTDTEEEEEEEERIIYK